MNDMNDILRVKVEEIGYSVLAGAITLVANLASHDQNGVAFLSL